MRSPLLAIYVTLIVGLLCGPIAVAEDVETIEIKIPDPQESFRIADLTPKQASLCAEFRNLAGKYRKPAFEALQQSGAFPIDEKRVSQSQVVALLGSPDREESGRMITHSDSMTLAVADIPWILS